MTSGRILIIDDLRATMEPIQDRLRREGYDVELATDHAAAAPLLADERGWDVVLLDMKLRGSDGPDDGLDLITEVLEWLPFAKVIMMSGVADEQTVKPAFAAGAYDYLEKGRLFGALLSVKVRNAMELARERRLGALEERDRELLLQQLLHDSLQEKGRQRKGSLLEELMLLLFKSIPGFENVVSRVRSANEEIDLAVKNRSTDPVWSREGALWFLVECKNWTAPSERNELDAFAAKLRRRRRCKVGFFVAPGGVSRGFRDAAERQGDDGVLVVPIDRQALEDLVQAGSGPARNERLKQLYEQAALQARM